MIKSKPTVLIATTSRWFTTARLAMALSKAGCTVDAVCPSRHPLQKTGATRRIYSYDGLFPITSFADAISAANPDLVIPSDDTAVGHLHAIHDRADRKGKTGMAVRALIERSLGAAESFPIVRSRSAVLRVAQEEGIRVPATQVVSKFDDLRHWIAEAGLPIVLKANGTSGGEGVRFATSLQDAERSFRILQAPPLLVRVAKRAIVDHDTRLVWPVLSRRRSTVNAQAFVAGPEATSLVACWGGEVLAGLHFEVVNRQYSAGPASVLRQIENPEMSAAAAKMAKRLNLSGFHGFDYVLEQQTGDAYLIEMNPRATQVGHLTLGGGRDLPAALYAAMTEDSLHESLSVTDQRTIALFPQEWARNPASPYLECSYHDVPWDEPNLIRACVRKSRRWSVFYSERKWMQVLKPDRLHQP